MAWVMEDNKSMEDIKSDLNGVVNDIIPKTNTNKNNNQDVPYMTDGEWIGEKLRIYEE